MTIPNAVNDFIAVAETYCKLLERAPEIPPSHYVRQLATLLPQLYLGALKLPQLETSDLEDGPRLSHEAWQTIANQCLEPLPKDDEPFKFYPMWRESYETFPAYELADDLADVYRDLKNGLLALQMDSRQLGNVVFEWVLLFRSHWGRHAVSALGVINELVASHDDRD